MNSRHYMVMAYALECDATMQHGDDGNGEDSEVISWDLKIAEHFFECLGLNKLKAFWIFQNGNKFWYFKQHISKKRT